jgi:chromosome segregation ATPase
MDKALSEWVNINEENDFSTVILEMKMNMSDLENKFKTKDQEILNMKSVIDDLKEYKNDLQKKMNILEQEKQTLNNKNIKLKHKVDEIEHKLQFVFSHMSVKPKNKEKNVKILEPAIWIKENKYEMSDSELFNLEYERYRNRIIRGDEELKHVNRFMPDRIN